MLLVIQLMARKLLRIQGLFFCVSRSKTIRECNKCMLLEFPIDNFFLSPNFSQDT